ncbi:MAG: prepilin-type N-terminal cleavage/methylation domain-containing protein [Proteobacteria bacterium]|nr:prepilin-type N-terminal cleavage/methylation domain-containing protein [Pseudomonadota bacterium]
MSAQGYLTRQGGYTLIEMLVALSLTGFLSTALLANVGMGARVWDTIEDRSRQSANGNVLEKVLRRHIELAVPLSVTAGEGSVMGGGQPVYFEGSSQSLRFFTEAGAGALPPGIYGVEFAISEGTAISEGRDEQDSPVLTVRRARTAIGGPGEDQHVIWDESRLPLNGSGAVFEYYSGPGGSAGRGATGISGWRREWTGQRALPELVRLSFGDGELAEVIVIAPALDYSTATMSARAFEQYFANIRG